uniref:C2H2-type domain-containing protein n=1 Tax=Oryzias latipes TaxID=8090 RepID=A0A3P9IJB1_ORYLA
QVRSHFQLYVNFCDLLCDREMTQKMLSTTSLFFLRKVLIYLMKEQMFKHKTLLCSPSNVRFLLLCSSGPHGLREEAGSKDSPEPQRDSEVDDVDQDDASAEDPEWKLESKQQKEVKKTADKTSKSLGERWKKRACKVCGFLYKSLGSLIKHTWTHMDEPQRAFGLKSLLKAHRRSHDENYQCHICGKTLSSTRALSRHLTSHSEKRNFACDVCGKRFKMPYSLKCHKKIHMDRERSFLCHICCKTFHCNRALNNHMMTHSSEKPEKPLVCQYCGKGFMIQAHLKNHQRVHTGERPFSCSHCGRCFKLKSTLKIHINTHLGIKRYTCTLCGKAASRLEHLKVHMRTHNGDRPYKCSLCDKAFTQSHCLKTHMMKLHPGENPSQNQPDPKGPLSEQTKQTSEH